MSTSAMAVLTPFVESANHMLEVKGAGKSEGRRRAAVAEGRESAGLEERREREIPAGGLGRTGGLGRRRCGCSFVGGSGSRGQSDGGLGNDGRFRNSRIPRNGRRLRSRIVYGLGGKRRRPDFGCGSCRS